MSKEIIKSKSEVIHKAIMLNIIKIKIKKIIKIIKNNVNI